MASPVARAKAALERARERWPVLDHAVRTQEHYGTVNGSGLAGSVTYFAFLAFFPILALAFFVVGYLSKLYPDASDNLVKAVGTLLPNIIGSGDGEIGLATIQNAAGAAGLLGALGLLYSGLGWLSGMRSALEIVFEMPKSEQPSFVIGKLRDLASLAIIGLTLLASVAVTGVVTGSSTWLLGLVGLGHDLAWGVHVLGSLVGLAANTLLFYSLFRLLARPPVPRRALWQGAVLGAIGFEILKLASTLLLASTRGKPAFQVLGIALILVIWINYFSRVVMYAAAWAQTSAAARAALESGQEPGQVPPAAAVSSRLVVPATETTPTRSRLDPRVTFGAGAAAMLGLVALLRRRRA
jgi:membrane protein